RVRARVRVLVALGAVQFHAVKFSFQLFFIQFHDQVRRINGLGPPLVGGFFVGQHQTRVVAQACVRRAKRGVVGFRGYLRVLGVYSSVWGDPVDVADVRDRQWEF